MSVPISRRVRFEIFKRDNFTCQYCGCAGGENQLEIDHIDPRSNGGTHDMANLITACIACNQGKGDVALNTPGLDRADALNWDLPKVSELDLPELSP